MNNLEIREARLEPVKENANEIYGRAVPYGVDTNVGDYNERIERGAITDSGDIKFFWQHREVIGRVIETEDKEDGFYIRATIADTATGRDALALLRGGVVDKFSIGFVPVESRQDGETVVRTAINLKEVSAVTFPAYADATIQEVRKDQSNETKEVTSMTDNTVTTEDLAEIREGLDNVERSLALINTDKNTVNAAPEFRDAGSLLKALVSGDERAERAYTGATTADSGSTLKNGWVGDLTRIVDESTTLYTLFSKGSLPDEGNHVEFSVLSSNSVAVTGQTAEGEPLTGPGKLTFTTKTAPVYTRGGYVSLSRQQIERTSISILNHTLNAQAKALGKDLENVVRQAFVAAVAARSGAAVTVASKVKWEDWQSATLDASIAFKAEGLSLDALIVSTDVFKALSGIKASDGRPIFETNGDGSNTVGAIKVKTLTGQIFNVTVVLDSLSASGKATFVNFEALRIFTKPAVRLQDNNIITLTEDFAVYQYIAVAPELPTGIVPVTITA
ncbi:HK97 family phage prohead protease [Oerskovia sp. NPDC060338]|uniref:HK97 family phage prohead protease n=1 Tax=Oerskovia sp. NPDC060338 TaxID=3347100 RepID=UPI003669CAED